MMQESQNFFYLWQLAICWKISSEGESHHLLRNSSYRRKLSLKLSWNLPSCNLSALVWVMCASMWMSKSGQSKMMIVRTCWLNLGCSLPKHSSVAVGYDIFMSSISQFQVKLRQIHNHWLSATSQQWESWVFSSWNLSHCLSPFSLSHSSLPTLPVVPQTAHHNLTSAVEA